MTRIDHEVVSCELEGIAGILGDLVIGLRDDDGDLIRYAVGGNSGVRFSNTIFAIRDFCWCDGGLHPEDADGIPSCPPNFEHFASGITGEWYKHLGRDTRWSRSPEAREVLAVLMDCIRSLPNQDVVALTVPSQDEKQRWGWKAAGVAPGPASGTTVQPAAPWHDAAVGTVWAVCFVDDLERKTGFVNQNGLHEVYEANGGQRYFRRLIADHSRGNLRLDNPLIAEATLTERPAQF